MAEVHESLPCAALLLTVAMEMAMVPSPHPQLCRVVEVEVVTQVLHSRLGQPGLSLLPPSACFQLLLLVVLAALVVLVALVAWVALVAMVLVVLVAAP